ncbi:hypothetical protein AAG590_07785 [Citromicrobium bathyomarinum]
MDVPSGHFEVTYGEAKMVEAYRFHNSRHWRWWLYLLVGAIFAFLFFVGFAIHYDPADIELLVGHAVLSAGVGAGLIALMKLANRYAGAAPVKQWASQFDLDGAVTGFQYDTNGLTITDRMFGGELLWREAHGWAENDAVLLIYRAPEFYYYIIKRDVEEHHIASLIAAMNAAGVKHI